MLVDFVKTLSEGRLRVEPVLEPVLFCGRRDGKKMLMHDFPSTASWAIVRGFRNCCCPLAGAKKGQESLTF